MTSIRSSGSEGNSKLVSKDVGFGSVLSGDTTLVSFYV